MSNFDSLATKISKAVYEEAGAATGTDSADINFLPSGFVKNPKKTETEEDMEDVADGDIQPVVKHKQKRFAEAVAEHFSSKTIKKIDESVKLWKSFFGVTSYSTPKNTLVKLESFSKDIKHFTMQVEKFYKDDIGMYDVITEAINDNRLNEIEVLSKKNFLYGTRIESTYKNVKLVFESNVDVEGNVTSSILISDAKVLEALEKLQTVTRIKNMVVPSGNYFDNFTMRKLRDIIRDM